MKQQQQAPDWFEGQVYPEGEVVTNPFSGRSIELTALELSIYDLLMGTAMMAELAGGYDTESADTYQKCVSWFLDNNVDAYYVLID